MKQKILCIVALFVFWCLLTGNYSPPVLLTGIIASLIIGSFSRYGDLLADIKIGIGPFFSFLTYLVVFVRELVRSNLQLAMIIVNPSLPINPGIVEVKTKLKSRLGRLLLANSITLTPGTLTVETRGDSLFIHWVNITSPDIEEATREIVSSFEPHLEVFLG